MKLKKGKKKHKDPDASIPTYQISSISANGKNVTLDVLYLCEENSREKPYLMTFVPVDYDANALLLQLQDLLSQVKEDEKVTERDTAAAETPKADGAEDVIVIEETVAEHEGQDGGLPSAAGDQSVDVEFEEEIVEYGEISEAQVFPLPLTAVLAGTRDIRHDSASSKEVDQELLLTERELKEQLTHRKDSALGDSKKQLEKMKSQREAKISSELEKRAKEDEERKKQFEMEMKEKMRLEEEKRKQREEERQRREQERINNMTPEQRKEEEEYQRKKQERERRRLERERRRREREARRREEERQWELEEKRRAEERNRRKAERMKELEEAELEKQRQRQAEEEALKRQLEVMKQDRVQKEVPLPPNRRLSHEMVFPDKLDGLPDWKLVRDHLLQEGRLEDSVAQELCNRVVETLSKEPNVFTLEPPVIVVGDVHGQYYDLVRILNECGDPSENTVYLFLGDYVDRGVFSCEVVFLLFALKLNFPHSILMLRGNHECRMITTYYSFRKECAHKYSVDTYRKVMKAFDALPLAATVNTEKGRYLCLHGGIGPDLNGMEDIMSLNRFEEVPSQGLFCDLLWADPMKEPTVEQFASMSNEQKSDWKAKEFEKNIGRECSFVFGARVLKKFLDENKFCTLVRAHEVQQKGYYEHFYMMDDELVMPLVITVFSAPNYCDKYENMGAVMKIELNGDYNFKQFSWMDHPYVLPNFVEAFTFSIPFIAENISRFFWTVLKMCHDQEEEEEDSFTAIAIDSKIKHTGRMMVALRKIREQNEMSVAPLSIRYLENLSRFEQVVKMDAKNEIRPQLDKHRKRNPALWRNVSTPLPKFLNTHKKRPGVTQSQLAEVPAPSPKSKFKTMKIKRVRRMNRGVNDLF